jgi:hypothetical protein
MDATKKHKEIVNSDKAVPYFDSILSLLSKDFITDDCDNMTEFAISAAKFAAILASRVCFWHVVDHEGYDCARTTADLFEEGFHWELRDECDKLTDVAGVRGIFREPTHNEKVAEELKAAPEGEGERSEDLDYVEDAECPVCGAVSPGALDCGCYNDIMSGKD